MAKRKRDAGRSTTTGTVTDPVNKVAKINGQSDVKSTASVIQIVAGTYERTLHGITATVSGLESDSASVQFGDSFLFNAHTSSIRCLALSPMPSKDSSDSTGVYLATGGSDERINVYSLSASPVIESTKIPAMPSLGGHQISENPRNRELGTILQHSSNVTALHFPTRSKLLSGAEDNTIAISRTRDLIVVSTIKAPRPKVQGQPSGDTAPAGATPAGINDFAVHPSMKLMISVGRAEKCMRLWNLVTGKKAEVLNFDRDVLQAVKEGRHSSGEGRKIRWNHLGDRFAVSFERGAVIFGADAKVKCIALPQPLTKLHQMVYHRISDDQALLVLSTEDGRVIFYDTSDSSAKEGELIPSLQVIGQLGGKAAGVNGRIKDFKVLTISTPDKDDDMVLLTAGSDGAIRVWQIKTTDLRSSDDHTKPNQIGRLISTYETGNRITCLDAFVMLPASDSEEGLSEFEGFTEAENESSSDSGEEE